MWYVMLKLLNTVNVVNAPKETLVVYSFTFLPGFLETTSQSSTASFVSEQSDHSKGYPQTSAWKLQEKGEVLVVLDCLPLKL